MQSSKLNGIILRMLDRSHIAGDFSEFESSITMFVNGSATTCSATAGWSRLTTDLHDVL
jgi:hypothetical protein